MADGLTPDQVRSIFVQAGPIDPADCELDNEGQLVFYTGTYKHSDGLYYEYPEESCEEEELEPDHDG